MNGGNNGKGVGVGKWLVVLLGMAVSQVPAKADWFTVTGNPQDPSVNTVEVDPVAVNAAGERKTINVRVSRSEQRFNWGGVPYRSYESQLVFDCRANEARYLVASFYIEPPWQGTPHKTTDYAGNPRSMLFRDVEPDPTQRIVRAACRMNAGIRHATPS